MNETLQADPQERWTPLQEAYVGKLMATYQANLYWLRSRFPAVFQSVMARQFEAPFEVGAEGELTSITGLSRAARGNTRTWPASCTACSTIPVAAQHPGGHGARLHAGYRRRPREQRACSTGPSSRPSATR